MKVNSLQATTIKFTSPHERLLIRWIDEQVVKLETREVILNHLCVCKKLFLVTVCFLANTLQCLW